MHVYSKVEYIFFAWFSYSPPFSYLIFIIYDVKGGYLAILVSQSKLLNPENCFFRSICGQYYLELCPNTNLFCMTSNGPCVCHEDVKYEFYSVVQYVETTTHLDLRIEGQLWIKLMTTKLVYMTNCNMATKICRWECIGQWYREMCYIWK